ncbi:cysteine--tRNA ligase [Sulfobacillus thermosulfidooxidans]|uniref:cysteine--tRNA ligase n=1 Tax=Sulfobacillus thermosulfidooxidans TaxID=28034 RepID=UPI0006B69334|nr:cysteine--tRNA ligase [Sulfobacillus thermosulfidooxidans]
MIQIYDSLTRTKRPFIPLREGEVSIYVCGVTPYAEAHVGHARPAVVWDVIKRHFMRRGYIVRHVQNFTDIDDKIVNQSQTERVSASQLAAKYMEQYNQLMQQLHVLPPDFAPRVTENIAEIITFIQGLIDRQKAYVAGQDVYFSVNTDENYGQLSGRRLEELYQGVRVEVHEGKHDPADFALWKSAPAEEPGWESPWGYGRPGWHIECSTMASRYLGRQFDLHGGGMDLIFPHHENERAQSQGLFDCEPAQFWVHNGLITQNAVKMSKSLGNGLSLQEIIRHVDPLVLRTYLLSVHYRTPLDFSVQGLEEWGRGLQRIWRLWEEAKDAPAPSEWVDASWAERLRTFESNFLSVLDDDFNTARAFAEIFDMVHNAYQGMEQNHRAYALGWARHNLVQANIILDFLPAPATQEHQDVNDLATRLIAIREQARKNRDYVQADQIRNLLIKAGYYIEDTPTGPRITFAAENGQTR